ncbi:MAG: 4-hydroxy-tetrahydrodipicolinate reductase [Spartobacteria bacterium]
MGGATRVLLVGAHGRMGEAVAAAAAQDSGLTIAAKLGHGDSLGEVIGNCDVVIDFSTADATEEVCRICAGHGKPLVLGTTGHDEAQKEAVRAAAEKIPLVFAANFSLGVNTLFALSRRAAELLGDDFDVDLVEMHHRTKRDAPSGTAKRLLEILQEARGGKKIAAQSIRAGDIVGEHTVVFSGTGERLELTHRSGSRATFAIGALRAARWAAAQKPGLYDMQDVLGL